MTIPAAARLARVAPRAIVFALIALVYVVLQAQQSLDQGPLAFPITYDDSGYYYEGLQRLHLAYDAGPRSALVDYLARPPHSAWTTGIAIAGFAVLGPVDWAPIAANAVVIALAAIALAWVTQALSFAAALAVLVGALSWRFMGQFALEFRPDMTWGLALAGFVAVASLAVDGHLSRSARWSAAILLAIALIAKMTTFPVTVAVVATLVAAVAIVRRRSLHASWRESFAPLAGPLQVAVLMALPIYLTSGAQVARYVYDNVFGAQAHIWDLPLTASGHLLYHLTGDGGRLMMGLWLVLWAITALGAGVVARRGGHWAACRPALPFAAAFLVAFCAVTLPAHKSPHIGAVVPAMFLVSWVALVVFIGVRTATGARPARAFTAAVWLLAFAGVAQFQWHALLRPAPGVAGAQRHQEAQARREAVERIIADIESSGITDGLVYVAGATMYLNAPTLRYYAERAHHPVPRFYDAPFELDASAIAKHVEEAVGVITFSDKNADLFAWLPSGTSSAQDSARRALAARGEPMTEFRYPSPGGGEVRLRLDRPPARTSSIAPRYASGAGVDGESDGPTAASLASPPLDR